MRVGEGWDGIADYIESLKCCGNCKYWEGVENYYGFNFECWTDNNVDNTYESANNPCHKCNKWELIESK
jgi:hypothetical protein